MIEVADIKKRCLGQPTKLFIGSWLPATPGFQAVTHPNGESRILATPAGFLLIVGRMPLRVDFPPGAA
jgi:hypothetical protein